MRSYTKLVLGGLVGCFFVLWSAQDAAAQHHRPITITRLYTGPDGQAHADRIDVKMLPSSLRAGLEESEKRMVSGVQFFRWPPGYVWDWHNAARPQYVIALSGRGEVEVAGRKKIPLNPGSIILAEDVIGKGHITRCIGSEDLVLLIVPFAGPVMSSAPG